MRSDDTRKTSSALVRTRVGEYLEEKRASSRDTTFGIYRLVLERILLPWLDDHDIVYEHQLTEGAVAQWITYLRTERRTPRGKPLSDTTVDTYATTTNLFLAWMEKAGAPRMRARAPKRRPRVLDVLSRDEMARLEHAAYNERDKLLIRVLADTGIRLGEALALRESDLVEPVRNEHALRVRGKGGERLVPLTTPVARRLRAYVQHARPKGYHGSLVFVGLHAVDGEYRVPGRTTVAKMVREAGERAGIKKRVHAHLLRHSAITHLLRQGTNPLLVAQYAGHTSLEMIRSTYSHLDRADLFAAVMKALEDDRR